jgi:rubredoxin
MPIVMSRDDIPPQNITRTHNPAPEGNSVLFFGRSQNPEVPEAFVAEHDPGQRDYSSHFHTSDEFQVVLDGKGMMGRHHVSPYCVHFARAYTPYGPLQSDPEVGWKFITCRAHPGGRAQRFAQDKLKQIPNRRPWQVMKIVAPPPIGTGVQMRELSEFKDDQGLFAYALSMGPGTQMTAPDPSGGDGQFILIVNGSFMHDGERRALGVVFLKPHDAAFSLHAGRAGMQALILNLPQVKMRPEERITPSASGEKYRCGLCAYTYDETRGLPEDGIAPGTRWEDVPSDWTCPDCTSTKSEFHKVVS